MAREWGQGNEDRRQMQPDFRHQNVRQKDLAPKHNDEPKTDTLIPLPLISPRGQFAGIHIASIPQVHSDRRIQAGLPVTMAVGLTRDYSPSEQPVQLAAKSLGPTKPQNLMPVAGFCRLIKRR